MRTAPPPATASPTARSAYLDRTVRVWLGLPTGSDVPRLPSGLERRLLRVEEYERAERDAWDCWDHSFSENFHDGRVDDPEIDRWVAARRAELAPRVRLEPLWPSGKRFAACLTHDVDVLTKRSTPSQMLRHAIGGLDRGGMSHGLIRLARPPVRAARVIRGGIAQSPSLRDTLEAATALESAYGATASYFFTVPGGGSRFDCSYAPTDTCTFRGVRTTVADVIRALDADGFDVGLHGSYYSAVNAGLLAAERATLRSATGIDARTTRQHFLHWDIARTPQLQLEAGFACDSSLGFNRTIGFRASTSLPFRHFDVLADRELPLLEVPLIVEDSALLGPIATDRDPQRARERVAALVDLAHEHGGAVTFLFHPDKLAHPEWLTLFEWSLGYAAERGGWLTSLRELERWWTERERKILAT